MHYGLSWEDSYLIPHLAKPDQRVITIGAAGCIPLSFLAQHPKKLQVVDVNPAQVMLNRLKVTAFQKLTYEEATHFLGCFSLPQSNPDRLTLANKLRSELPKEDSDFWKKHISELEKGIIHFGKFEKYLRLFAQRILPLVTTKGGLEQFLTANTLKEQQSVYHKKINTVGYKLLFSFFFGKFFMAMKGRNPDLLKYVNEPTHKVFYLRMEHLFSMVPIEENYFLRFILRGFFNPQRRLPYWLLPETFEKLQSASCKPEYQVASIDTFLTTDSTKYDVIYLSNACEGMNSQTADRVFRFCADRLSKSGVVVVWNNMVSRKPGNYLTFDQTLSESLMKTYLQSFYGFFGVYRKNTSA